MQIFTYKFIKLFSLFFFTGMIVSCQNQEKPKEQNQNASPVSQTSVQPNTIDSELEAFSPAELEQKGFAFFQTDPLQALPYFYTASEKYLELNNKPRAARAYANMTGIYEKGAKNIAKANEFANKALVIWKELGNDLQTAHQLKSIGLYEAQLGNSQAGIQKLLQAIELFKKKNAVNGIADSQFNLAKVYDIDKNYIQSEKYFLEASNTWEQTGLFTKVFTGGLFGLRLYKKMDERDKMQALFEKVMKTKEKIKMSAFFEQELAKTLLEIKIAQ